MTPRRRGAAWRPSILTAGAALPRLLGVLGIFSTLGILGACTAAQPPAASGATTRPALLVAATPQCRAEIAQSIGAMLQAPATLSDGAFTTAPVVLLERAQPRDAAGRQLDGRSLATPIQITLATDGARCFLLGPDAGTPVPLPSCACRAHATP